MTDARKPRFKLDANLPVEAAHLLGTAGYDAVTAEAQALALAPDPRIAGVCAAEGRALVTLDTDFSDIRSYPPDKSAGLIVLRPRNQSKPAILGLLSEVVKVLSTESPTGRLWIVEPKGLRIWPDPA